jgi:GntR family transcriptional regulator
MRQVNGKVETAVRARRAKARIERHSPVPIYHQLFSILRDEIFSGRFKDDEILPGDFALCRTYGVSRDTVRRALDELVSRGLIVRQPGQGTRVRHRPTFSPIIASIDGLMERTQIIGGSTEAEVLEFEELTAPPDVADILRLEDETVFMSTVVRRLDNAPFVHFTSWVPSAIGRRFRREDIADSTALSLLDHSGVAIRHIQQTIAAEPASRWVAEHLHVEPGAPLLRVERVVFADDDTPVEWSIARYPHDRHQYRINLQAT